MDANTDTNSDAANLAEREPGQSGLEHLIAVLDANSTVPLVFQVDGVAIHPDYHVTEVRFATVSSIDCGRNSAVENWDEIVVQLLDGAAGSKQAHMRASKFRQIIVRAVEKIGGPQGASLVFEFSPGNKPIKKLRIESIELHQTIEPNTRQNPSGLKLLVRLGGEQAVCKPFQRSKLAQAAARLSAGAIGPSELSGCCAGRGESAKNSCC